MSGGLWIVQTAAQPLVGHPRYDPAEKVPASIGVFARIPLKDADVQSSHGQITVQPGPKRLRRRPQKEISGDYCRRRLRYYLSDRQTHAAEG